jgi:hypothetical protein
VPSSQFIHVVATFDSTIGLMRIYLNGVLAAQTVTPVVPFRELDPNANPGCAIGNHSGFPTSPHNHPFQGLIDELQIYNRALSANGVQALYSAGAARRKAVAIQVQVVPDSPHHTIDLRSPSIRVAILSTSWFNAPREVDPSSLTFGPAGAVGSLILSQVRGEDVNGDGLPDLVRDFRTGSARFPLDAAEAVLKGTTTDSSVIVGATPILPVTQ